MSLPTKCPNNYEVPKFRTLRICHFTGRAYIWTTTKHMMQGNKQRSSLGWIHVNLSWIIMLLWVQIAWNVLSHSLVQVKGSSVPYRIMWFWHLKVYATWTQLQGVREHIIGFMKWTLHSKSKSYQWHLMCFYRHVFLVLSTNMEVLILGVVIIPIPNATTKKNYWKEK
jgi:hypothetical protein